MIENKRNTKELNLMLAQLKKLFETYPEIRLGQVFASIGNPNFLYYANDATVIKAIESTFNVDLTIKEEPVVEEAVFVAKINTETSKVEVKAERKMPENKGRIYINKDGKLKSVFENELENYLNDGWKKGRK